uniref:Beta-2-glycoprotein 1 n=1 Tax=Sinocyclocheilus grahami TaxID=75366 RepID=A0A672QDV8_SINGR
TWVNDSLVDPQAGKKNIKYENTEPVEKASYADGETVKVNCITGYTGLYRLNCEKGEWKKSIERPCAKRRCSHPGDTPNGDFKLKEGTEFVFGVTVEYTCKKGYEMTSRINHRTCRAQGWDNAVPVTASGNTEEGRYGDVIHFECVSSDKMIDGHNDIRCEETGKWSDAVPKCKETKCVAKLTENMRSDEHPGSEVSVRPGQTISFSCVGSGSTLQGQKKISCQSNGEWSNPFPKCTGKVSVRPGQTITFSCVGSGSTLQGQKKITCQSNGEWSNPFPKCTGKVTACGPPPDVNFADTIEFKKDEYNTGERVEYSCFNKYTLDLRQSFSKYLTCEQGEWRGNIRCLKPCTVTVEEMDRRGIELAHVNRQKMFAPHDDYISFVCKRGKVSVGSALRQQCNDGVMALPECVRQ